MTTSGYVIDGQCAIFCSQIIHVCFHVIVICDEIFGQEHLLVVAGFIVQKNNTIIEKHYSA
jgi:hypothetical protein